MLRNKEKTKTEYAAVSLTLVPLTILPPSGLVYNQRKHFFVIKKKVIIFSKPCITASKKSRFYIVIKY